MLTTRRCEQQQLIGECEVRCNEHNLGATIAVTNAFQAAQIALLRIGQRYWARCLRPLL